MNKKTNVKVDYLYKVLLLCSVLVFLYVFYSIFHIEHMPDSRFIPDPPVSLSEGWYTLDASGGKTTLPELNTWSITVSYTHLDVYKRQPAACSPPAAALPP